MGGHSEAEGKDVSPRVAGTLLGWQVVDYLVDISVEGVKTKQTNRGAYTCGRFGPDKHTYSTVTVLTWAPSAVSLLKRIPELGRTHKHLGTLLTSF